MNIPSNYLAAIGFGKNSDQTAEDGRLFVPPVLVPAFDVPRPAVPITLNDVSAGDGRVLTDSCVHSIYSYHQNQIAQDDTAFYLVSGLWRLQGQFIVQWDLAAAPAPLSQHMVGWDAMDQAGTRTTLRETYSDGASGTIYQEFDYLIHVKPRPDLSVVQGDVWTFFLVFAASNVAATDQIQAQINLNAQRYL